MMDVSYIPMEEFKLHWRFTDPKYAVLPEDHLEQIFPLSKESSNRSWDYLLEIGLHDDYPFKDGFFRNIESIEISDDGNQEDLDDVVKKFLYKCAMPFDAEVYLSWQPDDAVKTNWKMLVKYWSEFYYPISDDLTVYDSSMDWALLFFHEHSIHFGTNKPRMS